MPVGGPALSFGICFSTGGWPLHVMLRQYLGGNVGRFGESKTDAAPGSMSRTDRLGSYCTGRMAEGDAAYEEQAGDEEGHTLTVE